jgi:hypothetical protein
LAWDLTSSRVCCDRLTAIFFSQLAFTVPAFILS